MNPSSVEAALRLIHPFKARLRITSHVTRSGFRSQRFSTLTKPRNHHLRVTASVAVASVGGFILNAIFPGSAIHAEAPCPAPSDATVEKGRLIRIQEVKQHGQEAERKWVTRGIRVYDITDWISAHPGGEVILRGVGGAIDPYWDIFTIHKKQDVYDILEEYCIGTIDPQDLKDGAVPTENIDNPFKFDPDRDQRLRVLTARPCNAETPSDQLSSYITPNEVFYVRNHMWVPQLDDSQYKISLELRNGDEMEYTVADLKKFQPTKITATLQCSGNRRKHMSKEYKQASGLPWQVGGISTAEFTGVRLRDILAHAGFPVDEWPSSAAHVQFMGAEAYGASIPIEKATDPRGDVLLAYEMNGDTLPLDHGYPVRVVVPGTVAARSVKWLNKITLSDEESTSQWQRRDYKCFGPNEGPNPDWDKARSIQEMPVQSAITSLRELSKQSDSKLLKSMNIEEPSFLLEGYCFSGGGREIVRVDVSSDDGCTWNQAELLSDERRGSKAWAWKKWQWIVPKRAAAKSPCFVVKAVDEAYNCQPDTYSPGYNHKGNLTSAWHRVKWDG